jgi:hypothetical protein
MVADTTPDFYATMATIIRVLFLAFGASGGFSATSRVWGLLVQYKSESCGSCS